MTPQELTNWRKERNLNQGELASMLNVSRQTVIRWERGHHPIPDDMPLHLMRFAPGAIEILHETKGGHITPSSHPTLWTFDRNLGRNVPRPRHPWSLARLGLLGWPGCCWHNAWDINCTEPRVEMLETPEYEAAVRYMERDRVHPGVLAIRRHFFNHPPEEGVTITHEGFVAFLHRHPSMEPWHGFYVLCEPGAADRLRDPATDAKVRIEQMPPAGYWLWLKKNAIVTRKTPE